MRLGTSGATISATFRHNVTRSLPRPDTSAIRSNPRSIPKAPMIGRSYAPARATEYQQCGRDSANVARFDAGMRSGAQSPEELETLLEDAFVVRDRAAVVDLFEPDGLVAARAI